MQNISGQKRQKSSALPRNKRGALPQTHILDLHFSSLPASIRHLRLPVACLCASLRHKRTEGLRLAVPTRHLRLRPRISREPARNELCESLRGFTRAGRLLRRCATTVPRIDIKQTEGLRLAVPTQHPRGRSPRMSREPARNELCESLRGFTRAGRLLRRTATTVLPFGISDRHAPRG